MSTNRKATSQVAWSLLTEGVTDARLNVHRIRLLVQRALNLVDQSIARDHLYQVGGDLIMGLPEALTDAEIALDRTSYALTVMGQDFLRGRLPFTDRYIVDEAIKASPFAGPKREKESMEARVARRFLEAKAAIKAPKPVAPSAEKQFFDNPEKREVRQLAQVGAISNVPATAAKAVKEFEDADRTVTEAKQEAKKAPPDPLKIEKRPGGKQFSTLNRFIVETEQPKVRGVPEGRDELPKSKKIKPGR